MTRTAISPRLATRTLRIGRMAATRDIAGNLHERRRGGPVSGRRRSAAFDHWFIQSGVGSDPLPLPGVAPLPLLLPVPVPVPGVGPGLAAVPLLAPALPLS